MTKHDYILLAQALRITKEYAKINPKATGLQVIDHAIRLVVWNLENTVGFDRQDFINSIDEKREVNR